MSDMALGLYTCDIVCYGAASPGIFGAYTDALQARARAQVARYDNRGAGIPTHGESRITYATGAIEEATTASKAWMRLWPGYLVRESCFKCGHHSVRRPGDLTIGDFWGLERFKPELVDRWGVSLVLVNRGRGIDLLESAAKRITLAPATAEQAANEAQPMLSHPSARGKRDVFWAELYATDFSEACRRVGVDGFARRAKDCMRLTQKKIIKFRNGNVDSEGHGQPDAWSNLPSIDFDSIREAGEWPAVFAAVNRSDDVRRESSSGGVFHALASHVIEDLGGVVYGCAFDENLRAVHIRCEDLDQAKRCMGSKYSQSVMDNSIQNVADDLKRGRTVLFTGTPCQVAAVRAACGNAGGVLS